MAVEMSVELNECIILFLRTKTIHKNTNRFYLPWAPYFVNFLGTRVFLTV